MADEIGGQVHRKDNHKKKRDRPVVVDNREQAFHMLMQANARFEMATEELVLARDSLNEAIEQFKQIMPESFHLEMRTF